MSIRIDLQKNLSGELTKSLRAELAKVVRETAFAIEADAKQRAPVDTGALRSSIQADVKDAETLLQAEVAVGVEYGPYVELGTVHQSAQPFLTPAVEAQRQPFEQRIAEAIERAGK
mgnify:CR=1 FL=1